MAKAVKKDQSTEEKILAAAKAQFIKHGMEGARMQDIADEAGINKALLHYYFRSKDKLFETIFEELLQRLIPRINTIFESDMSIFQKIETFCIEYITKMIENPYIPLFILNELNKRPQEFIRRMWGGKKPQIKKFVQQLEEAVKKKEIQPIHPFQLLMNMIALCIVPFIGKPIFQMVGEISNAQYLAFMEERKKLVPQFIIASIKI